MALVKCGECGREVSDKAPACLGCGAPIGLSGASRNHAAVTVEQTGKKYKGMMLLSVPIICIGLIWWMAASTPGTSAPAGPVLLFFAGLGLFFYARFASWWNHG